MGMDKVVTIESLGLNRDHIIQTIEEKRSNGNWMREHKQQLREKYPDKYVAVYNGKVAGHSDNIVVLLEKLRKKYKGKDLSTFAIDLITKEDIIWIL
jgi:hypothetical protein